MTASVNVAGVAIIKVDTGSTNALETLGYTINGAEVNFDGFFENVPGDENGGDQGPPIDVQFFGETARVRLEMSKWDTAVEAKVTPRLYGGTAGTPGTAGTLMFGGSKSYRLLIHSTTAPMNFTRAFPRQPITINKGTKFSRLVMEWECHKDGSGVLWNTTTS